MIFGDFSEKSESPPTDRRISFLESLDWHRDFRCSSLFHRAKFGSLQKFAEKSVSGVRFGGLVTLWGLSGMVDFTARLCTFRFLSQTRSFCWKWPFLAHQDAADPQKWALLLRGVVLDDDRKCRKKTRTLWRKWALEMLKITIRSGHVRKGPSSFLGTTLQSHTHTKAYRNKG